jgi:hypothetical protein
MGVYALKFCWHGDGCKTLAYGMVVLFCGRRGLFGFCVRQETLGVLCTLFRLFGFELYWGHKLMALKEPCLRRGSFLRRSTAHPAAAFAVIT